MFSDRDEPPTSPESSGNAPGDGGGPIRLLRPSKRTVVAASILTLVLGLVAGVAVLRAPNSARAPASGTSTMPVGSDAKFAMLSTQHSNFCSLSPEAVMGYADDQRLQGSCCSPMDRAAYESQTAGLRRYEAMPEMPQDPYDIAAGQAKLLLGYDSTITLIAAQQETYDSAMKMTHDKGPCCCHCWRWFMTEGLAKFLIVEHSMAAQDVATVVDMTNGCGGSRGLAAAGSRQEGRSPA